MKKPTPAQLRADAYQKHFLPHAAAVFAEHPSLSSVVLLVAQYWDDEADDAVHESMIYSTRPTPLWSHNCDHARPDWDQEHCDFCFSFESNTWLSGWHDNGWAIDAFEGFCVEGGDQNADLIDNYRPVAIARRTAQGAQLEIIAEPRRPYLFAPSASSSPAEAPPPPLLMQVYEHPQEEAPRRVLADWLGEQNDPRGEFINLQLSSSARAHQRAQALLQEHLKTWMGPLAQVLSTEGLRFERGFLHSGVAFFTPENESLADHPGWATVQQLSFQGGTIQPLRPGMRSLKRVGRLDSKGLDALKRGAPMPSLEELRCVFDPQSLGALLSGSIVPNLRVLSLSQPEVTSSAVLNDPFDYETRSENARWRPQGLERMLSSSKAPLQRLELDALHPRDVGAWFLVMEQHPPLSLSIGFASPFFLAPVGWQLLFERVDGRFEKLRIEHLGLCQNKDSLQALVLYLLGVPRNKIKRVELVSSPTFSPEPLDAKAVREALGENVEITF